MKYIHFVVLAVFVAALEMILILVGVVTPVFQNSLGNMFFSLVQALIIAFMGWTFANKGFRKIAVNGAILMLAFVSVLCLATLVGFCIKRPVIGINATAGQLALILVFLSTANIIVGALIAICTAWLAAKIKK